MGHKCKMEDSSSTEATKEHTGRYKLVDYTISAIYFTVAVRKSNHQG